MTARDRINQIHDTECAHLTDQDLGVGGAALIVARRVEAIVRYLEGKESSRPIVAGSIWAQVGDGRRISVKTIEGSFLYTTSLGWWNEAEFRKCHRWVSDPDEALEHGETIEILKSDARRIALQLEELARENVKLRSERDAAVERTEETNRAMRRAWIEGFRECRAGDTRSPYEACPYG